MNERVMAEMEKVLEVNNVHVPQVTRLPRSVETVATNIDTHFHNTAQLLVQTAEALENRASILRDKAKVLLEQQTLAEELRNAVAFERQAFEEIQSLALVDVGNRPSAD